VRPLLLRVFLGVSLLTAVTRVAHAAPKAAAATDEARAMDLFQRGEAAYREGRFEESLTLLKEARSLKQAPVLLYDLARVHESLGHPEEAAEAYEQYLKEEPTTGDRKLIEARIERLRRAPDEKSADNAGPLQAPEAAPPPAAPAPDPEPKPAPTSAARVAVSAGSVGLGLVAIGAGTFFGVRSRQRDSDARGGLSQVESIDAFDSARADAMRANVCLIAGGALVAVGVLAWVLWPQKSAPVAAGSAGASALRWSF
jgi:tetratricopeptide (TPR) repeat protein